MAVKETSGFLKFKDANGDTNLFLPITTKDNVDGLDEIEDNLANAVMVTAQELTDDQKTQARENIGAIDEKYVDDSVATKADQTALDEVSATVSILDTTSVEEGSFLRCVSGVPTWSTIPNAEEASF